MEELLPRVRAWVEARGSGGRRSRGHAVTCTTGRSVTSTTGRCRSSGRSNHGSRGSGRSNHGSRSSGDRPKARRRPHPPLPRLRPPRVAARSARHHASVPRGPHPRGGRPRRRGPRPVVRSGHAAARQPLAALRHHRVPRGDLLRHDGRRVHAHPVRRAPRMAREAHRRHAQPPAVRRRHQEAHPVEASRGGQLRELPRQPLCRQEALRPRRRRVADSAPRQRARVRPRARRP